MGLVFEPAPELTEEELEEKPPTPALPSPEQAQQLRFHQEMRARIEKTQREEVRGKTKFQPDTEERLLLENWTSSSYTWLLTRLRGSAIDPDLQRQLGILRDMARKYEYNVPGGTRLYRGIGGDVESLGRFLNMKKGDVVEINDTFSSFSSSRRVAAKFVGEKDINVLIQLDHKSPWGWDISKFSHYAEEREVLVPRTTGRVKSVTVRSGVGGRKSVSVVMEAVEEPPQLGYYGQRLGGQADLSDVIGVGDLVDREVTRRTDLVVGEIKRRGEALRAESTRLLSQLAKLDKLPSTETIRMESRRLVSQLDPLTRERQLLAESVSRVEGEALKSVLQEVRPMGVGGTVESAYPKNAADVVLGKNQVTSLAPDFKHQTGWGTLEESFQNVINSLPRDWVTESSRATDLGSIVWGEGFGDARNRAFYQAFDPTRRFWCIGVPNQPYYSSAQQQFITLSHEYGHRVEDSVGGVRKFVREFYQSRTRGEAPISLGEGYVGEMTKKDKFTNPYIGKVYDDESTEVLSMGLQQALGIEGFGADAEFRKFIFGLLAAG